MDELTLAPYAARLRWRFATPQQPERWQALLVALLDELAGACAAAGPVVIGHIKALALLPGGGYLRGSKVSVAVPADVELAGPPFGSCQELDLSLNVLVYGLPLAETQRITPAVAGELASQWRAEVELRPAAHQEEHSHPHHEET